MPLLLRTLDLLMCPTSHNILRNLEARDCETHLRPQLRQLERTRLLERQGTGRNRTRKLRRPDSHSLRYRQKNALS